MAEKKIYIGSFGPYLYDDDVEVDDADGDFSGEYHQGLLTDGDGNIGGDLDVGGDLTVTGAMEASEIRLTPKESSSGAEGTIFYDSDDDHVYVATE